MTDCITPSTWICVGHYSRQLNCIGPILCPTKICCMRQIRMPQFAVEAYSLILADSWNSVTICQENLGDIKPLVDTPLTYMD